MQEYDTWSSMTKYPQSNIVRAFITAGSTVQLSSEAGAIHNVSPYVKEKFLDSIIVRTSLG